MTRSLLMPGDSGRRTQSMQRWMRVAGSALIAFALAMVLGGCAADGESCPLPQVPDGELKQVELPAGAVPSDDTDALVAPEGGASVPVGGGMEEATDAAQGARDDPEEGAGLDSSDRAPMRVDLVYFHTANPCGCMAEVEGVIDSSLRTHFAGEMDQKTVRFFSVVSDDPANQDLVRMYGSQQFDLFLVTYQGGRAKATQVYEIWSLLGDSEAIALAVKSRVAGSLVQSG